MDDTVEQPVAMPGMEVKTMLQERIMAQYRGLHPLDRVILEARKREETELAEAAAAKELVAQENARIEEALMRKHEALRQAEESDARKRDAPARRRKYSADASRGGARRRGQLKEEAYISEVEIEDRKEARKQAQLFGDTRSTSFTASQQQFMGRGSGGRRFPHALDPTALRQAMGRDKRIALLNAEVRDARQQKYNDDLRRMADCEAAIEEAMAKQPDGGRLRLGRIGQPSEWEYSGELFKRGQLATWNWRRGFFVIYQGLMYEFTDSSLQATIMDVWPIYASVASRMQTSTVKKPFVFTLRISPYYQEEGMLALSEFAAPNLDERAAWVQALTSASLSVSRLFRSDVNDLELHLKEVDATQTRDAIKAVAVATTMLNQKPPPSWQEEARKAAALDELHNRMAAMAAHAKSAPAFAGSPSKMRLANAGKKQKKRPDSGRRKVKFAAAT